MKKLLGLSALLLSFNSFSISFFTEADVEAHLDADKAIQISMIHAEKIKLDNKKCSSLSSKSARAYIVKKEGNAYLYRTNDKLADLVQCSVL